MKQNLVSLENSLSSCERHRVPMPHYQGFESFFIFHNLMTLPRLCILRFSSADTSQVSFKRCPEKLTLYT
jgi:hypothetical protein